MFRAFMKAYVDQNAKKDKESRERFSNFLTMTSDNLRLPCQLYTEGKMEKNHH